MFVEIRSLGSSGEGVGRHDGMPVFVEGALPGELVEVEVTERKRTYLKAKLQRIERASPERVEPPCPYYGRCGGCQLMHLSYAGQLKAKRQRVVDALERIGGFVGVDVEECIGADDPWHYRHKIQMPQGLGLYARGSHELIEVDHCLIHCEAGERLLQQLRGLLEPFRKTLRHLIVRTATTGEQLVILVLSEKPTAALRKAVGHLNVVANINKRQDNRILTDQWEVLAGNGWLTERLAELEFRVSAGSFFQVFPAQAEKIVRLVEAWAGPGDGRTAVDGCCGVGLLALALARAGWDVLGVEVGANAVDDARWNAKVNGLTARFECGLVEKMALPPVDLMLLNPPRTGCAPELLDKIQAERILYISCDPATLARDLRRLTRHRLECVQPVDLFSQTAHVETVALLSRFA